MGFLPSSGEYYHYIVCSVIYFKIYNNVPCAIAQGKIALYL